MRSQRPTTGRVSPVLNPMNGNGVVMQQQQDWRPITPGISREAVYGNAGGSSNNNSNSLYYQSTHGAGGGVGGAAGGGGGYASSGGVVVGGGGNNTHSSGGGYNNASAGLVHTTAGTVQSATATTSAGRLVDDPSLHGGGENGSVGIVFVDGLDTDRHIAIMTFVRNGAAERDGRLRVGDIIVEVDGYSVVGEQLSVVRKLILGPAGVPVNLAFKRAGLSAPIRVSLTRENPDEAKNALQQLREKHRLELMTLERSHSAITDQLQNALVEAEARNKQLERELRNRMDTTDRERRLIQEESNARSESRREEDVARQQQLRTHITSLENENRSLRAELQRAHERTGRQADDDAAREAMQRRIVSLEHDNNTLLSELQSLRQQLRIVSSRPAPAPAQEKVTIIENTITGSAGTGIVLDDDPAMEKFKVHLLVRGSSAEASGVIKEGDFVVGVDRYSVSGRPLSVVKDFIKGPVGTNVTLHMIRGDTGEQFSVNLMRGRELRTESRQVVLDSSQAASLMRPYSSGVSSPPVVSSPISRTQNSVLTQPQLRL